MNLKEDLRRALERAGDAEERAAKAEMEVTRLRKTIADTLTQEAEDQGLYPTTRAEDFTSSALRARDAARAKEVELTGCLRAFVDIYERTDGFDPRYCQPTVEKDNILNDLYRIMKR
ncbi:MAG: hypothetical protein HC882_00890 [Acidobacteria bacterium]|nr:hypothetical protein [Acidobacteriota bacterium]